MATRKVILVGIAEWAKVFEDNRDMKGFEGAYEEFDGACTIDMILDKENMDRPHQMLRVEVHEYGLYVSSTLVEIGTVGLLLLLSLTALSGTWM